MIGIQTQLFRDVKALESTFGSAAASADTKAIALFALDLEPAAFVRFAEVVPRHTSLYLADCYGILGFSPEAGRNIELLEAGRGREYGGVGGDGGRGVVAVVFSGGVIPSTSELPKDATTTHMVVAANGSDVGKFLKAEARSVYYGGVAKATYQYSGDTGQFEAVPYFCISSMPAADGMIGMTSFTGDAGEALRKLLGEAPSKVDVEAVALFPCFMRGKNRYGTNNVESDAVSALVRDAPVFGMFCHGELGPRSCLGFRSEDNPQESCTSHSMTTIVAVHASAAE